MKQYFLRRNGSDELLLVFGGWASERAFFPVDTDVPGVSLPDVLVCEDYRSLDFDASVAEAYGSLHVLAWSLGVIVAESVLGGLELPAGLRLAVNGTPRPVDDRYGIPEAVFKGTLEGLSERSLRKFRLRMCGSLEALSALEPLLERPLPELVAELTQLGKLAEQPGPAAAFRWSEALVGEEDRIFPAENQIAAWSSEAVPVKALPMAHYDATVFHSLLNSPWIKI